MLDVHAPYEKMHGFKDFFLHLLTITIGLLIALSLEGCVEWRHHRHLVHEAESSLRSEIERNSQKLGSIRQQIKEQQKQLDQNLATLAHLRAHPDATEDEFSFSYSVQGFDNVAWKTAQTTGAFSYMPYNDASEFSDIYDTQNELYEVQRQATNDVMSAASIVVTKSKGQEPTPAEIDQLTSRIGIIEMRLGLLGSLVDSLEATYQKYESQHH